MSDINLEHLTVRNCTHQGVAIRGAKKVRVTACDFSDNGSSVVPGKGLQHNLHITHSDDCMITDSRFDTSPFGSGINFIQSDGISVSNCEIARNSLNGIGLADCRNIKISGNLIEGNDGSGITAEPFFSGDYSVVVSDNISRNNGKSGIKINKATGGSLVNNRLTDNGNGNTPEIINSVDITHK
jgi:parallel beta-helix repeat protein